jgi:hypothetical protein
MKCACFLLRELIKIWDTAASFSLKITIFKDIKIINDNIDNILKIKTYAFYCLDKPL